jgi:SAM-dependent methyltransferase
MPDHHADPATFATACEAVLSAPTEDHSVDTTLAPIHGRTRPDDWARRRDRLVTARLPTDVARVLELGCGVGLLLRQLEDRYDAIGVDERTAHLRFAAAQGGRVVGGRPTAPPVRSRFDGVCAAEYAAARASAGALCVGAYTVLRPGGIAVVAAPTDASAVAESGVETYTGSGYRLERAVDIAGDETVAVDYRVTDRRNGDTGVTQERRCIETTSPKDLTAAFRTAGFEDVLVSGESDLPGIVVGVGVRPVETGS